MHSSRYVAGLLWLLASCYDAPRTNPFDPALTPAVELLNVVVDSTSGSALLEWTPYEGQQPFREYRVWRGEGWWRRSGWRWCGDRNWR